MRHWPASHARERLRAGAHERAFAAARERVLAAALGLAFALCTLPPASAPAGEAPADTPGASMPADGPAAEMPAEPALCAAAVTGTDIAPTAAPLALAAFGETRSASDLLVAMYAPSTTLHWPGNLKKYRLRAGDAAIVDAAGEPAVDTATGALRDTARSFWSVSADGADVARGGAAALVPAAPRRNVFTYLAGGALTAPANRVDEANGLLSDALLGTGGAGLPTREEVVAFIGGRDASDRDADGDKAEPRAEIGDALHSAPAIVRYGADDGLVFVATNDGFLHAVDLETGVERWAFVPPEFLDDQVGLYLNAPAPAKHYGIGGKLRTAVVGDADGIVEPGEQAYLYFGMRRGGDVYYGLDVTRADEPRLLFRLDSSALPGVGLTWSTPQPTRVRVQGAAQNAAHLVLVIGGGYEPDQDAAAASTDTVGNAVFIVDAVSGALLWHGSRDGLHADFATPGRAMDYSLPANVTVVDFDGDGYADRLYAADMGGQIWRFDITNGAPARDLVAGGVIAQFGAAPSAAPALADVRRFYSAPDVAIVRTREHAFVHVGIGSGHRAQPLGTAAHDRFYALRDHRLDPMTKADFAALVPVTDADMTPITAVAARVPAGGPGWRLDLDDGGWRGEKVLAEARTFADEVWFTTYRPGGTGAASDPSTAPVACTPPRGMQRLYRLSLFDGSPVANLDGSADETVLTSADRYVEREGGILPEPQLIFTNELDLAVRYDDDTIDDDAGDDRDGGDGGGEDDGPATPARDDDARAPDDRSTGDCGVERCSPAVICAGTLCLPASFTNAPVRTYWRQEHVDE